MNEVGFRNWMAQKGVKTKLICDAVSRLKRIEKELNHCDIDEEYRKDKCESIISLFENRGDNENMKKYPNTSFPIGKKYMGTYRHSLIQYIEFLEITLV